MTTKKWITAFIAIFATIGVTSLIYSMGASHVITIEPELMTLPAGASTTPDSNASNGSAVKFSSYGTAQQSFNFSNVSDSLTLQAKEAACDGDASYSILVDGAQVAAGSVTSSSWQNYTTTGLHLASGLHTVSIKFNNPATSAKCSRILYADKIDFTSSDTVAPDISITNPTGDSSVSGTTSISSNATDNAGVTKVEYYLDGKLLDSVTSSPYEYVWDTTKVANGTYTLSAKAYDAAGNVGTTRNGLLVDVNNSATSSQ